ncbi:hypothetical protein FSP39_022787 [Pinctada imbricata]|uniref:Sulfotransferase domain-containing protein n=1 Tax=Pinctada imbricata TaxID=66713 RepID=A0AA88XDU2_PINIB|nr:hypothetical protein FSP39_022787 [Pinctada imbricata]
MLLQGKANYVKEAKELRMLESMENLSYLDSLTSTRVLNTHLPYKWLPQSHIENGGKFIHTTRNPKDAYNSFYHKCTTSTAFGEESKGMTWSQFFDTCVIGKDTLYGTWFDYHKELELAKRTNKHIYTVHFENLKKNPEVEIKRLAQFLNVQCTDELAADIAKKCNFHNLQKSSNLKEFPMDQLVVGIGSDGQPKYRERPILYRKGEVGDWKNYFTVAQNERFDELYDKEMKGYDVKVIY